MKKQPKKSGDPHVKKKPKEPPKPKRESSPPTEDKKVRSKEDIQTIVDRL